MDRRHNMDTETVSEDECDFVYNCDTRNRFDNGRVGQTDLAQERSSEWNMARSKKRKRKNTGSLDISDFIALNKDEQLSVIFSKLIDIENTQHGLNDLRQTVHNNKERVSAAEENIDANTRHIKMLAYKQIDIETKMRVNNLIFRGFRDVQHENLYEFVRDVIHDRLEIDPRDLSIVQVYRLDSYKKAADNARRFKDVARRPILVTFRYNADAEHVFSQASRLRGTRYAIDRDYPHEIVTARRQIWKDLKDLREKNPRSKVVLKFPAKVEMDGNIVVDAFPDWDKLMKERATCVYDQHAAGADQDKKNADAWNRAFRPAANTTKRSMTNDAAPVYDADTESDSDSASCSDTHEKMTQTNANGHQGHRVAAKQHAHMKQKTAVNLPTVEATPPRKNSKGHARVSSKLRHHTDSDKEFQSQSLLNPSQNNSSAKHNAKYPPKKQAKSQNLKAQISSSHSVNTNTCDSAGENQNMTANEKAAINRPSDDNVASGDTGQNAVSE